MDFYVSLFFSGNPKRRGLSGVNRWQEWAPAVGYKAEKTISSGFFNGNPSGGQIFHHRNPILLFMFLMQNPKSVFQNLNLVLPIESTQNFRAVFPIFHMYSWLFWTLLNRNKIIFYWFTDVSTFRDTFSPTITLEIVKRK